MTRSFWFLLICAGCGAPCGGEATTPAPWYDSRGPVPAVTTSTVAVGEVGDRTWRTGAQATFLPTSAVERDTFARVIPEILAAVRGKAADPKAFAAPLAAAGFTLEVWQVGGKSYWVLLEDPARRRGAGAYLFRLGPPQPEEILLQAPHADYDVGTGDISAQLFFAPPPGNAPRALFLNTIHRYQVTPGQRERRPGSPADVAHNPDHLYAHATEAALTAGPMLVVQVHGFGTRSDDDGDDDDVPAGTTMIVSAGRETGSTPRSNAVAAALRRRFGDGVRRFPEDVSVLGATTNVQGRAARSRAGDFVHVEIAASLRKQLRDGGAPLQQLGEALFDTPVAEAR